MTFQIREAIDDEAATASATCPAYHRSPLAAVARDLCDNNMFGGGDLIRRLSPAFEADRRG
jgi:hypothetical protein